MSDPRFLSVHLEGLPRRDAFRAARERLQNGCGSYTLAGDLALLDEPKSEQDLDGQTATHIAPNGVYWVQDGENLYPLTSGVNSVGRLPDNSVVIRDECVSRRHCAIVIHRNGTCEIHDVASKNGTLVNGHKISGPHRLKPGDRITLCNRQLVFLIRDGQSA
jgi:FHA domain